MKKFPAFQFYPGDWMKDPALRAVSLAARGLWIDMLCLMFESHRRGYLVHKTNSPVTTEQLARMVGSSVEEVERLTSELEACGVLSKSADGAVFSRRMARDEERRQTNARNGGLGGNPNLVGKSDNPFPTTGVNPPLNRPPNRDANRNLTPSSSSSSSSSDSLSEGEERRDLVREGQDLLLDTAPRKIPAAVKRTSQAHVAAILDHWREHHEREDWPIARLAARLDRAKPDLAPADGWGKPKAHAKPPPGDDLESRYGPELDAMDLPDVEALFQHLPPVARQLGETAPENARTNKPCRNALLKHLAKIRPAE